MPADYDSLQRLSQNPVRLAVLEEKLAQMTGDEHAYTDVLFLVWKTF